MHEACIKDLEPVVSLVRAANPAALSHLNTLLEQPERPPSQRGLLRSLRAFALMQTGALDEAAAEAAALIPFATRHRDHCVLAQLHRVLACHAESAGEHRGRLQHLLLALRFAAATKNTALLARIDEDVALFLAEGGRFDEAAALLQEQYNRIDWANPDTATANLSLRAALAWVLNRGLRHTEVLDLAPLPVTNEPLHVFRAAVMLERFRAQLELSQAVDVNAIETLLAEALEQEWAPISCGCHLLLSRCYDTSSVRAHAHAELALLAEDDVRSGLRQELYERVAATYHARGDVERALAFEAQRDALNHAVQLAVSALVPGGLRT